jgi:hypothetical protein
MALCLGYIEHFYIHIVFVLIAKIMKGMFKLFNNFKKNLNVFGFLLIFSSSTNQWHHSPFWRFTLDLATCPTHMSKWAKLKKNPNNKGQNKHANEKSSQRKIRVSHWQNNQPKRRPRATYWRPSASISTN